MRTSQSPRTTRSSNQSNPTNENTENNAMPANAAQTDRPAITYTPASINTLSGTPLQVAFREVLGEEPSARAPVIALRRRIIAELKRREAEEATARAAGEAAHEAAVEAIDEATADEAQPEAAAEETTAPPDANEAAMRAAREAVAAGADAKACSDLLGLLEDGTIDSAAFHKGLETEVAAARAAAEPPAASAVAQDAPDAEPAQVITPAAAEEPAAPAPARDDIDLAIERARSLEPAAQKIFLDGFAKRDLHAIVERVTGTKTSGRLAPATAVTRILEALATPAQPAPSAATEQPEAAQPEAAAQPEGAEQPAEGAEQPAEDANDGAPASAETKPAGDAKVLPPVGTEIHKRDRHGAIRATCKVVEGGIEYNGKVYTSLSAAGLAATKDLGLTTKSVNGWLFWGLADQPRPARTGTPKALDFEAIEGAFKRYLERARAATGGVRTEDRAKLQETLAAHSKALLDLNAAAHQPEATPDGDSAATEPAAAAGEAA